MVFKGMLCPGGLALPLLLLLLLLCLLSRLVKPAQDICVRRLKKALLMHLGAREPLGWGLSLRNVCATTATRPLPAALAWARVCLTAAQLHQLENSRKQNGASRKSITPTTKLDRGVEGGVRPHPLWSRYTANRETVPSP